MSDPSESSAEMFAGMESNAEMVCEYAGHEWADAGGDLLICVVCTAEKWRPATDQEKT